MFCYCYIPQARAKAEKLFTPQELKKFAATSELAAAYASKKASNIRSPVTDILYLLHLNLIQLGFCAHKYPDTDWAVHRDLVRALATLCHLLSLCQHAHFHKFKNFFPSQPLDKFSFSNKCPQIYIIISPLHPKVWYLGSTTRSLFTRFREHIAAAMKIPTLSTTPLYRKLHNLNPFCFIIIPISYPSPDILRSLETKLIHRYSPPLNSSPGPFIHKRTAHLFSSLIRLPATPHQNRYIPFTPISGATNHTLPTITFFSSSTVTSRNPYLTFHKKPNNTIFNLEIHPGSILFFNARNKVARRLGNSIVLSPRQYFGQSLKNFVTTSCLPPHTTILIQNQRLIPLSIQIFLQHIAKNGWKKYLLFRLPLYSLLYLLLCSQHLSPHKITELALGQIKTVLYKNYYLRTFPTLLLKIPFNPQWKNSQLIKILTLLLHLSHLPSFIIQKIMQRSRIVYTSRPSIKDIFCNHIRFFKKFPDTTPPCSCATTTHTYQLPSPNSNDLSHILSYHANFVPIPNVLHHIQDLASGISLTLKKIALLSSHTAFTHVHTHSFITQHLATKNCVLHTALRTHTIPTPKLLHLYKQHFAARTQTTPVTRVSQFFQHLSNFTRDLESLISEYSLYHPHTTIRVLIPDWLIILLCQDNPLYCISSLEIPPSLSATYVSPLITDSYFNASATLWSHPWTYSGTIYPPPSTAQVELALLWALASIAYSSSPLHFFFIFSGEVTPLLSILLTLPSCVLLFSLPANSILIRASPFTPKHIPNTSNIYCYCIANYNLTIPNSILGNFHSRLPNYHIPHHPFLSKPIFAKDFHTILHWHRHTTAISSFLSKWSSTTTPPTPHTHHPPPADLCTLTTILNLQRELSSMGLMNFDLLFSLFQRAWIEPQQTSTTWSPSNLSHIRKTLSKWVITPVDKNASKIIMICPIFAYNNARATFIDNTTNYKVICSSPSTTANAIKNLYSVWHRTYHANNWHNIHPWPRSFSFPYAYIIPKWKDVALHLPAIRSRPIISCASHPCRQLFRCIGQAILLCLQKIDCLHFSLWKTQDVKKWIVSLSTPANLPFGTATRFLCGPGDIANCFDRLSHTYILDSLHWLFVTIYKQLRCKGGRFHVNHTTNRAEFGRAFDSSTCCEFDSNDAFNVVLFALENSFFTLGNNLLRQILGSPMGAQMSSALAILVCIRGEHTRLSSMGVDAKFITARRYVDDVAALSMYKHNDPPSFEKAKTLLSILRHCYHTSLIVKPGDVIENSSPF